MTASQQQPANDSLTPSQLEMRFIERVAEINGVDAAEAGRLAFLSRVTVQANLPLRNPGSETYERRNGDYTLTLQAPPSIGLPYGRYPRLLLAFLGREAVRTKSPEIHLGDSLSSFMREVGVTPSGGQNGPIRRFREQTRRLLATTISCSWEHNDGHGTTSAADLGQRLASKTFIWWTHPGAQRPDQAPDGGYLVLTNEFFEELLAHPVPVDARALRVLSSPLAVDLYTWLTWRMSHLPRTTSIPWRQLALQFGTSSKRVRSFREQVNKQLVKVLQVYPAARVESTTKALTLRPSPTHVPRLVAVPTGGK